MDSDTSHRPGRRLPAKPVIYRSSALSSVAPNLANNVYNSECIREAARIADEVRERHRAGQTDRETVPSVEGTGEAADAQRHHRRVALNRSSAASSRVRKEAYVGALEEQLAKLESRYNALLDMLQHKCPRLDHVPSALVIAGVDAVVDGSGRQDVIQSVAPSSVLPASEDGYSHSLPLTLSEAYESVAEQVGFNDTENQGAEEQEAAPVVAGASEASSLPPVVDEACDVAASDDAARETHAGDLGVDQVESQLFEELLMQPPLVDGLQEMDPVLSEEIMRVWHETTLADAAVNLDLVDLDRLGNVPLMRR